MANYRATYTTAEKKLFAERLRRIIIDRGLKNAEVARMVSKHLPKPIPRQLVSSWMTGMSIPEEQNVKALEKALDIPAGTLLPRPHKVAPGEPLPATSLPDQDVRMSLVEGGQMQLTLNVRVPQPTGWEIVRILQEAGILQKSGH